MARTDDRNQAVETVCVETNVIPPGEQAVVNELPGEELPEEGSASAHDECHPVVTEPALPAPAAADPPSAEAPDLGDRRAPEAAVPAVSTEVLALSLPARETAAAERVVPTPTPSRADSFSARGARFIRRQPWPALAAGFSLGLLLARALRNATANRDFSSPTC